MSQSMFVSKRVPKECPEGAKRVPKAGPEGAILAAKRGPKPVKN